MKDWEGDFDEVLEAVEIINVRHVEGVVVNVLIVVMMMMS